MKVLAFDFGASSGRAIIGTFENGKISLSVFNKHVPVLGDRKITVNKITISYKIYRDNNAG